MWALTARTQRGGSQEIRSLSLSATARLSQNHCALQNKGYLGYFSALLYFSKLLLCLL